MDLFSDILMRLAMRGTLYFRTAFSSPWGVEVPAYPHVARFHFAHRGTCLVRVAGAARPVRLREGDLVIIPHGAAHSLYGDTAEEGRVLPLDRVLELSGFTGTGTLVYGGAPSAEATELVCGHFAFDPLAWHPLIERLPPCLHIADYGGIAGQWLAQTLRMIGDEAGRGQPGGALIAQKMSEIIFAQVLRAYIVTEGAALPGLAGLADPQIVRALEAVHAQPDRDWSVADLARIAGLSRTGFATRFADRMRLTPMAYVTRWRMQIARQELQNPARRVPDVAESVGYISEAAFARVFRKEFGLSPAAFRRAS